jgi:hypothetical protein
MYTSMVAIVLEDAASSVKLEEVNFEDRGSK